MKKQTEEELQNTFAGLIALAIFVTVIAIVLLSDNAELAWK